MQTRPFSKIIAGTMTWGAWGKNYNTTRMIGMINTCLENNITTFDHADIYGDYTTEASFGTAFKESKIDRNLIQVISKCGIQMQSENRKNAVKHYEYSSDYIVWSVEQSLKNLQTDYLDLLLLHRPSPLMNADEIAKAIDKLKSEGKILDFGVSNFTSSQMDLIEQKVKISYNQIEFSLTHFEPMLDGTLDHMQIHDIKPMCWSPMGSVFSKDDQRSVSVKLLAENFSQKYGVPVDVILLAWILKHPAQILPVCGTTEPSRIANLMTATTLEMELQDWFALWSASSGSDAP